MRIHPGHHHQSSVLSDPQLDDLTHGTQAQALEMGTSTSIGTDTDKIRLLAFTAEAQYKVATSVHLCENHTAMNLAINK